MASISTSTTTSIEERERVLAEQEKVLDEREKQLVLGEKKFDRGDLDKDWEDVENAQEAFYQTEIGQRILALDEKEAQLKMKKEQLNRWSVSIIQRHQRHQDSRWS
jgi:hypothetical protein